MIEKSEFDRVLAVIVIAFILLFTVVVAAFSPAGPAEKHDSSSQETAQARMSYRVADYQGLRLSDAVLISSDQADKSGSPADDFQFAWPDIAWPDLPQLSVPQLPELRLPAFPELSWPEINFPTFSFPDLSFFSAGDEAAKQADPQSALAAASLNALAPASGGVGSGRIQLAANSAGQQPERDFENQRSFAYPAEDPEIQVDTILVPQKNTVISSSRDGQIKAINFENGDLFQKNDVLIAYDCRDIEAELAALKATEDLSRRKALRSMKLLKLEIISDVENLTLDTEKQQAEAERKALQQRLESCTIRAGYDGRVTNRLANPGEYTRTDRVLMEVSSLDDLEAEFLLPSRWLRWVNVGAPVKISLLETGKRYEAVITRIHGEVDPASQSIQMTAKLAPYADPLLPGMSGSLRIDIEEIREAGIAGYLEAPAERP